ncbi:hypothetical protein BN14_00999 [Rhizoctonia solani AG-1 IB]|uniref:Uncharacterized protein n=1 Tax=Thanatephorus cucumeris (strain AG1-IB / isolate 7/3/14) TaxID=1108050 RepID=M5BJV6_THACB|nr:hypothetical protein BN14_00999 [Rhizoctonia solani AG-1 IB]
MADNAKSSLDQSIKLDIRWYFVYSLALSDIAQLPLDALLEQPSDQHKKSSTRPFLRYTRAQLLYLSKSPLVTVPNGMPHFKDWFGEWGDSSLAATKKEPMSEALGQLPRDRTRFRRDTEEGEGSREPLSSGRPTFKNALSFSQASGSAMGSMGSFRHPSSRLESDARREEREREREREGRRETENLRNLSQQFDRERRDREAAPHLHRIVSGASSTNGRDPKSRDPARDNAKDPPRETRRGRGDDAHDWRKAREDDKQRSRSRPRGKGEREPGGGSKREKDNWAPSTEERRGAAGRRRNAAGDDRTDGKVRDDRTASKNDRDKLLQEEEPAWMGDYVPEAGSRGILGLNKGEDSIQAWKRELKEKERAAQGIDADSPDEECLGGLEDDVAHMKLVEEEAKKNLFGQPEDDGLDEIQRFKKLMQESERQRREEAERDALERAGKSDFKQASEQNQPINGIADASVVSSSLGPPGLIRPQAGSDTAPTPPVPEAPVPDINGRIGGISLGSSTWPVSAATTPSTTAATLSTPGWTQSGGSGTDSASNPRLSPVQARRFTQDGSTTDGAVVGTRSTSRFANFFGDKHKEPSAPHFSNNVPAAAPAHSPFMQGGNDSQLLETLLARLTESQVQPPQTQDRVFAQRNSGMPPQPQYGATPQNIMNMQHAQPQVIQHQRAQLSIHQQQQQQLLSSLNARVMSNNPPEIHNLGHNGPPGHIQAMNSGLLNPSLNLDIDGRFVSDNLVPGLRPRNGSVAFDEDFQVNPAAAGIGRGAMQQHRPQQSFDALHRQQQQQPAAYNLGGNRTPSGGFRNGPSPIGGHNPNPMQRAPDLPQYLGGMSNPLAGGPVVAGGNANGPQQQYGNRLGAMGNLGNMLGAGGPPNQPRFDERQRIQQGQAIHHQSGQSLSGIGGLPLEFGLLHQQQPQRQMPRSGIPGVGGYPMQQNQSQMGPRNGSGLHGGMGAQYPGHMHNDFVVQPNQTTNASDIMAMFLANQGNAGMGGA